MQITKNTQDLLDSFVKINPSILIKSGSSITTISAAKNILAKANIPESFEHDVCIYDLNQFLNALKFKNLSSKMNLSSHHVMAYLVK